MTTFHSKSLLGALQNGKQPRRQMGMLLHSLLIWTVCTVQMFNVILDGDADLSGVPADRKMVAWEAWVRILAT